MTALQSPAEPSMEKTVQLVDGPAVWLGSDLAKTDEWIYRLSEDQIAELDAALRRTQERGLAIIDIGRDDFPLPTLGPVLAELQDQVVNGRGFALVKRIPVERYTPAEAQTLYWGMGLYWGDAVSQNGKGHVLGHVKDLGMAEGDPARRGYQTTLKLRYHTDSCDIVCLMCLAKAKSGGLSSIASSGAIHNEILRRRPDLIDVLRGDFFMDRKCEVPDGKLPYAAAPVFNYDDGYMTSFYPRGDIDYAQRFDAVPKLNDEQREALALMDTLAEDFSLKMDIELGDIQLLHNHTILHARTSFEDYPEFERKRHMVRLWLSAPNGRPLPPSFADRYGSIEVGTVRGGIVVSGMTLCAPTEAV
ncbi:MAG: TauD/TfdA family dioxygenase [Rhodospirillales bacterium]|nr:TauD/TfdA family dioxygenase [Rhodospirillales bacterium]